MDELIAALVRALENAGMRAVRAFPEGAMPKLTQPVTAVGLGAIVNEACGGWQYLGMWTDENGRTQTRYGRELAAEALLHVYCPRQLGGRACMAEAEKAAAMLAEPVDGVRITEFSVGPCGFDGKSDCFRCTLTAKTRAYLYVATNEDETEFTDFVLKGEVK